MRIVVLENSEAVAKFGANHIASIIKQNSRSVLGLATGSSPIELYRRLINAYENKELSFKDITTFNLDEYLGLASDHAQSYRHFMNSNLFDAIDINISNTFVPDGATNNPLKTCAEYEALITQKGGVDIQLLGIGQNGHIGFNEPSSSLVSRTRVKTLTKNTVDANKRFFKEAEFQPYLSLTMGIGTIMEAKEVLLIATGVHKAKAIKQTIEGPVSAHCPASILQMHPKATIVIDQDAAQDLDDVAFYEYIEKEQQRLLAITQQPPL